MDKNINSSLNESDIVKELLKNPNTNYINELFAYIPMRLTGLGLAERIKNDKAMIFDRKKENFATNEFMNVYASIPICIQHPTNEEGKFEPLGFKHSSTIIGNAIHSFLRDDEIWVIARLHNLEAVEIILNNDISTSPYFITKEVKHEVGSDVIYEEIPIVCNHLAIVADGFWDKKISDKQPISKERNMSDTTNTEPKADENKDQNTEPKADENKDQNTEPKADSMDENMDKKADSTETKDMNDNDVKADVNTGETSKADMDIQALLHEIEVLKGQVNALTQAQDSAKSDEELEEKDEIIEAINEIADSNEFVNRVRVRNGDSAKDVLQNFLKNNKKHISEKYHILVDSMPDSAYSLAKSDILDDMCKNLSCKQQNSNNNNSSKGWQFHNGNIIGYKF